MRTKPRTGRNQPMTIQFSDWKASSLTGVLQPLPELLLATLLQLKKGYCPTGLPKQIELEEILIQQKKVEKTAFCDSEISEQKKYFRNFDFEVKKIKP